MTHDPLCEATDTSRWWESCYCDIIARVREDERAAALRDAKKAVLAVDYGD